MGQRGDGTIFFFADSEPTGSENESPAGQIFEDLSPGLIEVFNTKTSLAEGPITDSWGTWISALTPIIDPDSGKVIAVLGMDYDANSWRWSVATRSALPAGLILMVVFLEPYFLQVTWFWR